MSLAITLDLKELKLKLDKNIFLDVFYIVEMLENKQKKKKIKIELWLVLSKPSLC